MSNDRITAQEYERPDLVGFVRFSLYNQIVFNYSVNNNRSGVSSHSTEREMLNSTILFPISFGQFGINMWWEVRLVAFGLSGEPVRGYVDGWAYYKTYNPENPNSFYIGGGIGYYSGNTSSSIVDVNLNHSGVKVGLGFGVLIATLDPKSFVDIYYRYSFHPGRIVRVLLAEEGAKNVANSYERSVSYSQEIGLAIIYTFE